MEQNIIQPQAQNKGQGVSGPELGGPILERV